MTAEFQQGGFPFSFLLFIIIIVIIYYLFYIFLFLNTQNPIIIYLTQAENNTVERGQEALLRIPSPAKKETNSEGLSLPENLFQISTWPRLRLLLILKRENYMNNRDKSIYEYKAIYVLALYFNKQTNR